MKVNDSTLSKNTMTSGGSTYYETTSPWDENNAYTGMAVNGSFSVLETFIALMESRKYDYRPPPAPLSGISALINTIFSKLLHTYHISAQKGEFNRFTHDSAMPLS